MIAPIATKATTTIDRMSPNGHFFIGRDYGLDDWVVGGPQINYTTIMRKYLVILPLLFLSGCEVTNVLIMKSEDFDVTIDAPKYVFVGQTFDVTGSIKKTGKREVILASSGTDWYDILVQSMGLNPKNIQPKQVVGEMEIKDPWSVRDKLRVDSNLFTPTIYEEPREDVKGNAHEYKKQFTCNATGIAEITYSPAIRTPNVSYKSLTPNNVDMSTNSFPYTATSEFIECLDYIVCSLPGEICNVTDFESSFETTDPAIPPRSMETQPSRRFE